MKQITIMIFTTLCLLFSGCGSSATDNIELQEIQYHDAVITIPKDLEEKSNLYLEEGIIYSNIDESYDVKKDSFELYAMYDKDGDYEQDAKLERKMLEEQGVTNGIEACKIGGRNALLYEHEENGIHIDEYCIEVPDGVMTINTCVGKEMIDVCHLCISNLKFNGIEDED